MNGLAPLRLVAVRYAVSWIPVDTLALHGTGRVSAQEAHTVNGTGYVRVLELAHCISALRDQRGHGCRSPRRARCGYGGTGAGMEAVRPYFGPLKKSRHQSYRTSTADKFDS